MGMQHFEVLTDHYPLISILNHHRLDKIENLRLQCLHTNIQLLVKGATNQAPDALSCKPTSMPSPEDLLAENDGESKQEPSVAEIWAIHRDGLEVHNCKSCINL